MTIIDKIKWQNLMLMIGKNLMAILVKIYIIGNAKKNTKKNSDANNW